MKKNFLRLALVLVFVLSLCLLVSCEDTYTVTFNSDGGSPVEAQVVELGAYAKKPNDPTKEGFTFVGWFSDNDEWKFEHYAVVRNVTLTAKWTANYTAEFDSDGGNTVDSQTVPSGEKIAKPVDPHKDGYIFLGWFVGDVEWNFDTEVLTKDVTIKAKWLKIHSIIFDTDGGTTIPVAAVNNGEKLAAPADPEKAGFIFKGWFVGEDEWNFDTAVTSNITLTAKWAAQHTVSFDSDGGGDLASVYVETGFTVNEPDAISKAGYVFGYWYDSKDAEKKPWSFDSDKVTSNITLKAYWRKIHTVSFDTVGGTKIPDIKVTDGELIPNAPDAPVRLLYLFEKWMLNESTDWDFANDRVTSDITLTAKWKINYYTVIFDLNGGEGNFPRILVEIGKKIGIPSAIPEKENCAFVAWLYNGQEWNFEEDTVDTVSTITLTAQWADEYFTVLFDVDGNTSLVPSQNVPKSGGTVTRPAESPSKQGYDFLGWYYNDQLWNFSKLPTEDMTLTAKWAQKFTVSFDAAGGSDVSSQEIRSGQPAVEPDGPIKSGWVFLGWYIDDETKWDFDTPITEDVTLTAKWEKIGIKVIFYLNGGATIEGSPSIPQQNLDNPGLAVRPDAPLKNGYVFAGWATSDGKIWDFDTDTVEGIVELTAQWKKIHNVIFNLGGGSGSFPGQRITDGEKLAKLTTAPTLAHHSFLGWYELGDSTPWDFDTPITEDIVLVAKWQKNIYQITFDANEGTPVPETQYVEYGSVIVKPAEDPFRAEHYEFRYWTYNGQVWDFTKTPEGDMTLVAHWTQLSTGPGTGVLGPWDEGTNTKGPIDDFE